MAYSLVRYEFEGPGCKSRKRAECCIFLGEALGSAPGRLGRAIIA